VFEHWADRGLVTPAAIDPDGTDGGTFTTYGANSRNLTDDQD
jgi:hypothetical protein